MANHLRGAERNRNDRETVSDKVPQRPSTDRKAKLKLPGIKPGYVGYLAIDKPGNIEDMVQNGWEFVYQDSFLHDVANSEDATQMGTKYTIPAGGGFKYYGMQIRKEWYDEIIAENADTAKEREQAMKHPSTAGTPANSEAYIPSGGGLNTTYTR